MKTGDIYIYGDIYNEQSDYASAWGVASLKSVKDQLVALPSDTTDIIVHIHSRGGDVFEGFAIHDFLSTSNKNITTKIEGLCASIATIVALSGSTRIMTKNSTFMIHNPSGFAYGTADEMQEQADFVKNIEEKIVDFYVKKTGKEKSSIEDWMKEEKFMTSDEALELNFITEIAEDVSAAALFIIPKKQEKNMSKETEGLLEGMKNILNSIKSVLGKNDEDPIVDNLKLNTKDGKSIEIVTDKKIPNVNDKVLIDGKAAPDSTYEIMDGTKIDVADGKVTKVTDGDGNTDSIDPNVVAQLKAENESLKKDLNDVIESQKQITETLKIIADNIQSSYDPKTRKHAFNSGKQVESEESPVAKAIRLKNEKAEKKS